MRGIVGSKQLGPKVLVFDIETAPMLGYVWSIWEQNVGLNQIHSDWFILSWAAKWLGAPVSKIMYADQRNAKNIENDKVILEKIWKLLDVADVVITQNGKSFDQKKLNARFILQGMQPPSPYKHIDTKVLAKKHFAFTSNSLEYMTDKCNTKFKKLKTKKFKGFDLWKACLNGNKAAWAEMEKYNKHDVLSTEELYKLFEPWGTGVDFNLYHEGLDNICGCGSTKFEKNGYRFTASGKYQRYRCFGCGASSRGKNNLLTKEKKASLRAS